MVIITLCFSILLPWDTNKLVAQTDDSPATLTEHLIVVVGAAGSKEYESEFVQWAKPWQALAAQQKWKLTLIGEESSTTEATRSGGQNADTHHAALRNAIAEHAASSDRLWIVLLGHGTYAASAAKFNLVGTDVSAKELLAWLKPLTAPVVVINCSSASSPFLTELAGRDRVLLTATRAGSEINFARFGKYLSQSLTDMTSDVDHDLEVSLLEAFLAATARTERFYREESRLTTEHALLDDNGDRAGVSGDFFRGVRPIKSASKGAAIDGSVAKRIILFSSPDAPHLTSEQQQQRTEIESDLDALRNRKATMSEEDYMAELEQLMLQLSKVYDSAEAG